MAKSISSISVVIPVYNEEAWITRCLGAIRNALSQSGIESSEVIVVDDGSTDATRDAVESESQQSPSIKLISQANRGRWHARLTGLETAKSDYALLIDSRVLIDSESLSWVNEQIAADPTAQVWNSHVEMDVTRNLYARFWRVITQIAWRRYFRSPKRTRYDLRDFDYYPKGTTCFLAPTRQLIEAYGHVGTMYSGSRHANDDAHLIRHLASTDGINIAPEFRCTYYSRTSLRRILQHTLHRGAVFVDGYLTPGNRYFLPLVAFYFISPLFLVLGFLNLYQFAIAVGAVMLAAWGAALFSGSSFLDAVTFALLVPPLGLVYGLGTWKGLFMKLSWRGTGKS